MGALLSSWVGGHLPNLHRSSHFGKAKPRLLMFKPTLIVGRGEKTLIQETERRFEALGQGLQELRGAGAIDGAMVA
jgi:hypothetical protein